MAGMGMTTGEEVLVAGMGMTTGEKVGVAAGAVAVAAGLQKVYEVKRWTVPTPVWLGVTAGLTWLGFQGYRKITSR